MRRLLIGVLVSAACLACGPKRPDPKLLEAARQAAELRARAEEDVLKGCYDCLLEAKAAYTRLATGPDRQLTLVRLFEVELLIALREKELAIDSEPSIARARALIPDLPASLPAARYLAVVEAVPADASGLPIARDSAFRRSKTQFISGIDTEIVWMKTDESVRLPVRQYLSLAIDCSYERRARPPQPASIPGAPAPVIPPRQVVSADIPADAPSVVQYRLAICGTIKPRLLEGVRKDEARYAEGAYFLARLDVARAQETGAASARPLLKEAHDRFPNSPAVTYLAGNYNQLIGDCKEALKYYDETIAIEPQHDNALLGRTICLAYLKQFDESIATATRMIAIPTSNLAEAYYWRAWVKHVQNNLPEARTDIERAKGILSNNAIHRLAGIIEYDQNDLTISEKDLTTAKAMSDGQYDCTARWYLGLVEMKREKWPESGAHFEDAMSCYERAAQFAQDGLRKMKAATNVDEEFRARQIAGFEAAIKEDTSQQYASAFNAANHFARGGNPGKARPLLDVAARDPDLAARVAELRKLLGGG